MASSLAPQQTVRLTRRTITPTSALLQELLNEQRGRRISQTNSASSEESKASLEDRQVRSSPTGQPKPKKSSSKEHVRRSSDPIKGREAREAEAKKNKEIANNTNEPEPEVSEQRQRSGSGGSGGSGSSSREARRPREMGIKETNAYVDKISKENFNLKLELFHRRERETMLEKRLEKMEMLKTALDKLIEKHKSLESENEELQDVNEHLLEELEKSEAFKSKNEELQERNEQLRGEIEDREQTVKEAASIIVNLEYEVGQLEIALVDTRPSTAETATETDTNYLNTSAEGTQPPSSPLQTYQLTRSSPDRKSSTPRLRSRRSMTPRRGGTPRTPTINSKPSFTLSSVSYSTRHSLASGGDGEDEDDGMRSDPFTMRVPPSLSVLSESGFPSIYGSPRRPNHEILSQGSRDDTASKKKPENEAESRERRAKEHRKARVDQWIQDRYLQPKKTRTPRVPARADSQHTSTGEPSQPTAPVASPNDDDDDDDDDVDIWRVSPAKAAPARKPRKSPAPRPDDLEGPSFAGPIFGTNFLPPVEGTPGLAWTYEPPPPPAAAPSRPHTADAVVTWAPLALPHAQADGGAEGAHVVAPAAQQPGHGRRGSGIVGFGRKVSLRVKKRFGRRGSECPEG